MPDALIVLIDSDINYRVVFAMNIYCGNKQVRILTPTGFPPTLFSDDIVLGKFSGNNIHALKRVQNSRGNFRIESGPPVQSIFSLTVYYWYGAWSYAIFRVNQLRSLYFIKTINPDNQKTQLILLSGDVIIRMNRENIVGLEVKIHDPLIAGINF